MNKNTFGRLLKYIGKHKKSIIFSIVCAVISVIASLISPRLIGQAIDKMFGRGRVDFTQVLKILFILGIVYLIGCLFTWILTYLTNQIAYKVVNDMRSELFQKINSLPLKFFDGTSHGDTISRFINDADAISDGILQGLSTMITGIITIFGAIYFMLQLNALMTVVVLLSAPVSFLVARFITLRSQKMFKENAKCLGNLNGYVEEIIGGQKVVEAYNYQQRSFKEFKEINGELYNAGVKSQFIGSLSGPTTRLVNNITYAVIGVIGSVAAIMGKITVGEISSFLIYSNLFAKPFNDMTAVFTQIQAAAASGQRIFKILDMEPEKEEGKNYENSKPSEGNVEFKNVNFSYDKKRTLITNFNLKVKPGNRIAIVGHTGAGKTTIVNLLMRFYDVDSGSILIDGINIKDFTRDSLRRNFGMVLQDTWLFEGTIRDNIAYGKPDATEDEIIAAAKAADAHSFIRRLSKGYDTVISDGGDNISEGQRQLLTIARVMLVDPPILILDEATSNIDTRTEIHIQKAFLKMVSGRTSFIIAHRLSTIKEADLILVMDNGNIVERGTHEQLLKNSSEYAKLYYSQFAQI